MDSRSWSWLHKNPLLFDIRVELGKLGLYALFLSQEGMFARFHIEREATVREEGMELVIPLRSCLPTMCDRIESFP